MKDFQPFINSGSQYFYAGSIKSLAAVASATNLFTVGGSATKTIRIFQITLSGIATAAGTSLIRLVKQSTADSGGTSTSPTLVPFDSTSAAATAVVKAYTANPTPGTPIADVGAIRLPLQAAAALGALPYVFDFYAGPIVLRGTAEQLAINLDGVTITGGAFSVAVLFSEE